MIDEAGTPPCRVSVDHVEPNRGDAIKFWNGAVQSLCVQCHESREKFHERRGYDNTIVADGMACRLIAGIRSIGSRQGQRIEMLHIMYPYCSDASQHRTVAAKITLSCTSSVS
jgi:hypothetical protein